MTKTDGDVIRVSAETDIPKLAGSITKELLATGHVEVRAMGRAVATMLQGWSLSYEFLCNELELSLPQLGRRLVVIPSCESDDAMIVILDMTLFEDVVDRLTGEVFDETWDRATTDTHRKHA